MGDNAFTVPPAYPSWIEQPGPQPWWINQPGGPEFQVKEVAKIFFRRSGSWLRMRMQPSENHPSGWFTDGEGNPLQYTRVHGKVEDYSFRRFSLRDVERMLWSYYRHEAGDITRWYQSLDKPGRRGEQRMLRYQQMMTEATYRLQAGIELVKWIGRLYGLVPPPSVTTAGTTDAG
jgi:hypothetical protein